MIFSQEEIEKMIKTVKGDDIMRTDAVVKGGRKKDEPFETQDACIDRYQDGLDDAWEAARKIQLMSPKDLNELFSYGDLERISVNFSASEAIEKLKALEEKNEIKVGDEIVYKDGVKGVVVGISNNGQISVLNDKYAVPQLLIKNDATKTGKHYDQIEEVLKQMQEETK